MANSERGEVELTGLEGKTYVLKFDNGAKCEIEQATGKAVLVLLHEINTQQVSHTTVRAIVKASSTEKGTTDSKANALMDDVGFVPLMEAISRGLTSFFDGPEARKTEGAQPEHKRRRTSGAASSSPPPK